jgi:hypothetical protein
MILTAILAVLLGFGAGWGMRGAWSNGPGTAAAAGAPAADQAVPSNASADSGTDTACLTALDAKASGQQAIRDWEGDLATAGDISGRLAPLQVELGRVASQVREGARAQEIQALGDSFGRFKADVMGNGGGSLPGDAGYERDKAAILAAVPSCAVG